MYKAGHKEVAFHSRVDARGLFWETQIIFYYFKISEITATVMPLVRVPTGYYYYFFSNGLLAQKKKNCQWSIFIMVILARSDEGKTEILLGLW